MKLKYNYAVSEIAGQTVAVPIDSGYGEQSIIKTNETGAYILELLKEDITFTDILQKVNDEYEIESQESLKNWLEGFIDKLKAADVLIYE